MDNNLYGWTNLKRSVGNSYVDKCRLSANSDEAFSNFRRDPDYQKVLEGGERKVGQIHLNRIQEKFGLGVLIDNIDKIKENDIYGNPVKHFYDIIGTESDDEINPCTILYVSQALDIKEVLDKFVPKKIVEIGGGFGGLCKTLSVFYDFDEYVLIDLPDVIDLCKKYLSHYPDLFDKITFIDCEQFQTVESIDNVDLFIAIASLAECNEKTQNIYVDKILMNSLYGYILYNTLHIEDMKNVCDKIVAKISGSFENSIESYLGTAIIRLKKRK